MAPTIPRSDFVNDANIGSTVACNDRNLKSILKNVESEEEPFILTPDEKALLDQTGSPEDVCPFLLPQLDLIPSCSQKELLFCALCMDFPGLEPVKCQDCPAVICEAKRLSLTGCVHIPAGMLQSEFRCPRCTKELLKKQGSSTSTGFSVS